MDLQADKKKERRKKNDPISKNDRNQNPKVTSRRCHRDVTRRRGCTMGGYCCCSVHVCIICRSVSVHVYVRMSQM